MKILITGASGFLGSHIVESFIQQGHEVRCLVRPSSNLEFLKAIKSIELIVGNLNDQAILQRAVRGVDAIVHAAGSTQAVSPYHYYEVNVDGTLALLTAARQYADSLQRFVLISSLAAIGGSQSNQILEDSAYPPAPVSHYGRSKLMAEYQARLFIDQLPITIIRPPIVYGPHDKKNLIFFKMLQKGLFISPLKSGTMISTIYAPDVASAIHKAVLTNVRSGSTYFVDDGNPQPSSELLNQLAEVVSGRIHFKATLPYWLMKSAAVLADQYSILSRNPVFFSSDKLRELQQPYWICNSEKTKHELNWVPTTDWLTGINLTYDWYKKAGWC